jgi:sucrose-6-phosphate hydrolase SacC (GH32 family)
MKIALPLLVLLACLPPCRAQPTTPDAAQHYLFSYFTGNGEDGLHLAYSPDGLRWRALNGGRSLLTPTAGEDKLMRDPSIVRGPDGTYHMVWTVSWNERGIGYASSKDLVHWSAQRYLPVMEHEPTARNCWAPELFYDEATGQYLVVWATTLPGRFPETDGQDAGPDQPGWNHRLYYVTTRDFETLSETRLFYDHGFNVIDGTLARDGSRYVLFLKDETNTPFTPQKNLRVAFAERAEGPYGPPSAPITGDYWAEGPTVLQIGGRWHVYFDKYTEHHYGLVVSDDLARWTDASEQLEMPEGMRHGTAFAVPEETARGLLRLAE